MALLPIKLLIFINKGSLWNWKQPIYTLNSYIYHKIIERNNVRGTAAHTCCTEAIQLYLRNDLSKKHRSDWIQTIVVIFHDHKLRGHHLFYKTVWKMAQHQQPNWKIGLNKLNLCWNFSLTVRLSKFPVTSWLLRCHLVPSKD